MVRGAGSVGAERNPQTACTVVSDPSEYGFRPGAYLVGIGPSLDLGVFEPGTIISRNGRLWRVHGALGSKQVLVRAEISYSLACGPLDKGD